MKIIIDRIRRVLLDIKRVVGRAQFLMGKAQQSGDDGYLDGVALNLHGFYAGVKKIFEDIARTLEKAVPKSSGWHQDLTVGNLQKSLCQCQILDTCKPCLAFFDV